MHGHGRQKLLIAVDWFDPAVRAGGPVQICVNLVNLLHAEANVAVVTGDRDHGDQNGFSSVTADHWRSWRDRARVQVCHSTLSKSCCVLGCSHLDCTQHYLPERRLQLCIVRPTAAEPAWLAQAAVNFCARRGMSKLSALKMKLWMKQPWLRPGEASCWAANIANTSRL